MDGGRLLLTGMAQAGESAHDTDDTEHADCAGRTNHADETDDATRHAPNHAESTAQAPSLLALDTIVLALALASAAYITIRAGQYIGMVYGVSAYYALIGHKPL